MTKARPAEHPGIGCEPARDGGNHEEEHVGHENAVSADLVGQIPAQERADNRAERNR
jgi:hypothetical protein